MILDEQQYLEHYGTPRRSGRYPWGSGGEDSKTPRNPGFMDQVREMRKGGLSDKEIYKAMNITSTEFRAKVSIAKNEEREANITQALALQAKGYSDTEGARKMGVPGATYRSWLEPGAKDRADVIFKTADMLKQQVAEKGMIDVGSGVEVGIGISPEKLRASLAVLKEQGYPVHPVPHPQAATTFKTQMKVLCPPGTTQREAFLNRDKIQTIQSYSSDGGRSYGSIHDPISIHPNRITVNYNSKEDGVIYVRPGVKDVEIGQNHYAQVRVLVGENHYLKGMALYKNDLPPGTDLVFNTNKSSTGNKLDAMKEVGPDKDYPFGSVIRRQITADTGTKHERVTSAMNIVNEEGNWATWRKSLSSQILSKQSPVLAQQQLDVTYNRRVKELNAINALTNPTVKKKLLNDFAGDTDSAAADLKAASFKRSAWQVILPVQSLKPNEVYAPSFNNGEHVALIRYPHAGTFEIPQLVVNNRNSEARLIGTGVRDAIGIHPAVAQHLSGADFDGDAVLVVPNKSGRIKSTRQLDELKNFDHIQRYRSDTPIKINTQNEMGRISNLITDMTLQGAPQTHIVRAVKHSMVVIDAEKHNLNYKQSARDNGIPALKAAYQSATGGRGASTLISRKKQTERIPARKPRTKAKGGPIDLATGRLMYETRLTREGKPTTRTETVNKLRETTDAHTMSSGTRMETIYADHSNRMKALANQARLDAFHTPLLTKSPSAAHVYEKEVASLDAKLSLVKANRPRERRAQVVAAARTKAIFAANPNLDKDGKKRVKFAEQERARARLGAKQKKIEITNEEWNAIQAGAISDNKLSQILDKADMDVVRKLATPSRHVLMTPSQTSRAKALLGTGKTRAEVAQILGVSLTTLDNATNE